MNRLPLEMALRLYTNRQRGERSSRPVLGSVLGIALSMIPLLVVLFMSDGMIRGITDRFIETSTYHIQLRNYDFLDDEEMKRVQNSLMEMDDITLVTREHKGMGMAYSLSGQSTVNVRGLDPQLYNLDEGFRKFLTVGEGNFDLSDEKSAMIGEEIARNLDLKVGDEFRILTGKTLSTGKYIPKVSRFTVRGIFSTGYQDLDKLWVFVPFDRALKILQDSEASSIMGVKILSPYGEISPLMSEIRTVLSGKWGVYSWKTLNRSHQSNFETTRTLLVFIMILIVLVAVMNISSSMVMLVMENEQAIGIQKSMGLPPSFLTRQYIITAALAGGTGSLIGIGIGCFLTLNLNAFIRGAESLVNFFLYAFALLRGRGGSFSHIELLNRAYYLDEFPVDIKIPILLIIFTGTVLLCIVASFIPVLKASRIKPLDILRKH